MHKLFDCPPDWTFCQSQPILNLEAQCNNDSLTLQSKPKAGIRINTVCKKDRFD